MKAGWAALLFLGSILMLVLDIRYGTRNSISAYVFAICLLGALIWLLIAVYKFLSNKDLAALKLAAIASITIFLAWIVSFVLSLKRFEANSECLKTIIDELEEAEKATGNYPGNSDSVNSRANDACPSLGGTARYTRVDSVSYILEIPINGFSHGIYPSVVDNWVVTGGTSR